MDKKKVNELADKAANALSQGAKKLDEAVDKRSVLGELSAPVMAGASAILLIALIKAPDLLLLGAIVGLFAASPKLLKFVRERAAAMKKSDKKEENKQ